MKTFSRLSLLTLMFFSVAFLLIGNVPHANAQVRAGMDIQVDPAKVVYNPETDGDVLVTFELTADGDHCHQIEKSLLLGSRLP